MGVPSDFAEMMSETITLYPASTIDAYGKQSYGAGVTYQARLVYEQKILRDSEGREIVQQGRAIIYGVATGSVKDRLQLPDGTRPLITSFDTVRDEDGDHHSVIGFG